MNTISPNMGLPVPGIGTELSPTWASDLNASLSIIDSHNHSVNQGNPIQPNGLNINSDLAFQNNNGTQFRSTRFTPQPSVLALPADIGCLYVVGNELYYNDVTGGNNIQITANGLVNATSSGISSGTASAAFSAGVLVCKSTSTSGANVLMQSAVLTNSGNLTNQLTLQAPTLAGSITETLPAIPVAQSFMTIDASGNMAAYAPVANGITRSNQAAVGQQISSSCGLFNTNSTSFVSVTNLSVSLTTTGRPVMLMLQPDGTANEGVIGVLGSETAVVEILRGATVISVAGFSWTTLGAVSSSAMQFLDTPSSGTYTYSIKLKSLGGATAALNYSVLVAYEL